MKKPYVIAFTMFLAISLWMVSGLFFPSKDQELPTASKKTDERMLVETRLQNAEPVQLALTIQGHVEPQRHITIHNDVAGRIAKMHVQEGMWVPAGTLLFELDIEDRNIKLAKENAILLSRQKAYARAQTLVKQNLQAQSILEDDFAALKAAEANVAQIKFEIDKLAISAPFDGVVDTLLVEQNSYVAANSQLVSFVDSSTLVVVAPVAQQSVRELAIGTEATVNFATGETRTGKIRFISPVANESTRTFRVEIGIDNSDRALFAGISAEVIVHTKIVDGHFVSPAILVLDAAGQIGVKSVDTDDTVVFTPISIIKASAEGIWVKGLPATTEIITIGQGFVEAGVKVDHTRAKAVS